MPGNKTGLGRAPTKTTVHYEMLMVKGWARREEDF
jgi:hypothetical protein